MTAPATAPPQVAPPAPTAAPAPSTAPRVLIADAHVDLDRPPFNWAETGARASAKLTPHAIRCMIASWANDIREGAAEQARRTEERLGQAGWFRAPRALPPATASQINRIGERRLASMLSVEAATALVVRALGRYPGRLSFLTTGDAVAILEAYQQFDALTAEGQEESSTALEAIYARDGASWLSGADASSMPLLAAATAQAATPAPAAAPAPTKTTEPQAAPVATPVPSASPDSSSEQAAAPGSSPLSPGSATEPPSAPVLLPTGAAAGATPAVAPAIPPTAPAGPKDFRTPEEVQAILRDFGAQHPGWRLLRGTAPVVGRPELTCLGETWYAHSAEGYEKAETCNYSTLEALRADVTSRGPAQKAKRGRKKKDAAAVEPAPGPEGAAAPAAAVASDLPAPVPAPAPAPATSGVVRALEQGMAAVEARPPAPPRALTAKGDESGAIAARSEAWALAYVPLPSIDPPPEVRLVEGKPAPAEGAAGLPAIVMDEIGAAWAGGLLAQLENLEDAIKAQAKRIQASLKRAETQALVRVGGLRMRLDEAYGDELKAYARSNIRGKRKSIDLMAVRLSLKSEGGAVERIDDEEAALIAWTEEHAGFDFVKRAPALKWADLKKWLGDRNVRARADGRAVVDLVDEESGEAKEVVVPGVRVTPKGEALRTEITSAAKAGAEETEETEE